MLPFDQLEADSVAQLAFTVATPSALYGLLAQHPSVAAFKTALGTRTIDADDVLQRVRVWLGDFVPRIRFRHEAALCALVVAVESHGSKQIGEFIEELASLHVAELSMASRVARIANKRRKATLSANTAVIVKLGNVPSRTGGPRQDQVPSRVLIPNSFTSARVA